ncbi:NAD-P-binding protein [Cubamyces sp. BRFM 1775]|nr:NAD-P-binding protein [Cubamyces sp. BRFM 1775]
MPSEQPTQNTTTATPSPGPLRIGILGAARIAPNALIKPAQSHPDVAVTAVACRDAARGTRYARKWGITRTFSGPNAYHELVADPEIDVVYIPLPNGLHFEWSMRALEAGKHILVEKPMTSTAEEARQIFALAEKKGLVALEAMHSVFHPAMQRMREIVQGGELGKVKSVETTFGLPGIISRFIFGKDDVRFNYDLAGGCMMDMGVYPIAATRFVTGTDSTPLEVTSAMPTGHPSDPARIDRAMHATFALPDSATGSMTADLALPGRGPLGLVPRLLPQFTLGVALDGGRVELWNYAGPHVYHWIKVRPARGAARTEKAYKYKDGRGDAAWSTYRYQLEAFVDKVRGRTPWYWIEPTTTITEMETVERVYAKAGMPPRVPSSYKPAESASA